ncbi:MAG TPA: tRNA (adenosine(37)-N6)-dimethylallyltransferase MiaA [Spirochaetota bacterium]|nr:tRNA (adenosine(37)-N6)-dimethylallyltransferase MiaA [Spirochaetota bacterium]
MSFKKLVIVGPTASGKSDLAIEFAGNIFEIVSADSVQVYRYMDIGSGKPSAGDLAKVPHHLIDIVDPDYQFTAGDFCKYAEAACERIYKNKKIPLFAGGTGLYIDSFFKGLSCIPDIPSQVRECLIQEMDEKGAAVLYEELLQADPVFAAKIHVNDRQRILRGLQVFRGTGRPISSYYGGNKSCAADDCLFIGLYRDKDDLSDRINLRVDRMIKAGFVDEVQGLRNRGYTPDLNSMKTIGYMEINEFIDNKRDLASTVENIKLNTRQFAKKQMTWFKRNRDITWFNPSEKEKIKNKINNLLNIN